MMPVAILCGGKGIRLSPLTNNLPKSLVDVCGKPFIVHQLKLLKRNGYTNVVLLVGHLGSMIESYLGDGNTFGMNIRYSWDDVPNPNAAIIKALPLLGNAFFVLYGDSYLDCNYQDIEVVFHACTEDALLTTYNGIDYGLRAFRHFPAQTWIDYPMPYKFQEMGSFDGLTDLRATILD